jgi:hypothetical protein
MVTKFKPRVVEEETLREDVPVGDIVLDVGYGRQPNTGHIKKLADDWDDSRAGVVYLSLRDDGTMACLDGWHRVQALREARGSKATIPARVYFDLTVAGEAALYTAFNRDRRALQPIEVFRSRLVAGDARARAIDAVVRRCGLSVNTDPAPGHIAAVRSIEIIYEMGGEDLLGKVLTVLTNAWGNERTTYNGFALFGVAHFLVRYPHCDEGRLVEVISRYRPNEMHAKARQMQQIVAHDARGTAWGRVLLVEYNKRLRRPLPEWQEYIQSPGRKRQSKNGFHA